MNASRFSSVLMGAAIAACTVTGEIAQVGDGGSSHADAATVTTDGSNHRGTPCEIDCQDICATVSCADACEAACGTTDGGGSCLTSAECSGDAACAFATGRCDDLGTCFGGVELATCSEDAIGCGCDGRSVEVPCQTGLPDGYTLKRIAFVSDCAADAGTAHDAGSSAMCGLTFFPSDYPTSCQTIIDSSCCPQEQACAADPSCTALVKCINACPTPRQDMCVNACEAADGGVAGGSALNAIGNCSKSIANDPTSCDWPN